MNYRRFLAIAFLTTIVMCLVVGRGGTAYFRVYAQQAADTPTAAAATIRAESRLVLVDVVVTDKKNNYIEDLTQNDFKVWQDDQEQKISSFSSERQSSSASAQKRHLVLFFDDDSMQPADQARARQAAVKFLDDNSGAGNYVAILDYAGTLKVAQNFTDDTERLKKVAGAPKLSIGSTPNASLDQSVFSSYDSFSNRNVLLALRSVARSMATIPGRKSLIWLTAGFPPAPDLESDMTALINTCNKANVAVYPLDVRGVTASVTTGSLEGIAPAPDGDFLSLSSGNELGKVAFDQDQSGVPHLVYVAQTKTGGGGTGSRPVGTTTGTKSSSTMTVPSSIPNPFSQQPRSLIPPLPPSTATNQQVLYEVAIGTGGFVIGNTNDLLNGLGRIGKEQSEYYVLGYVPPESSDGACHTLRVKVERSGVTVRARSGYCATKPVDLLAGKPLAKTLEEHALAGQPGAISGYVAAPYFYTSPETARVNLAIEIPAKSFQFDKVKGKQHAVMNVLGMALRADGTVAARFSDTVEVNLEKAEMEQFTNHPYHYENQFYIAGGQYTLKLAVSSGDKFGQFALPLVVDHYDPAKFSMSDLALSTQFYKVADLSTSLDSLLQDRTPLVTQGLQMLPSGSNRFKQTDRVAIYLEVYEPSALQSPPKVGLRMRVLDKATGVAKLEANVPDTASSVIPGNPVIPMGVPLPVAQLRPGNYVVELRATDSAGNASTARKVEFTVE